MMPVSYAFTLARQSITREKWLNLLSVLTIAAALFIISIALLIGHNLAAMTQGLPERFSVMVYLDPGLPRPSVDRIADTLRKKPPVESVRFIPKEEALKELKGLLKDSADVFAGLDENPLPDSLELKIRKQSFSQAAVKELSDGVKGIRGVKDVDYGERFIGAFQALKSGMETGGLVLIGVLAVGIVFVSYSTVKILFYRRNEEIETFKLLGATRTFIRAPFVIEGAIIGSAGGAVSLLCLALFHYVVLRKLGATLPLFAELSFPVRMFLPLPLVGFVLGCTGAAAALGRLKY